MDELDAKSYKLPVPVSSSVDFLKQTDNRNCSHQHCDTDGMECLICSNNCNINHINGNEKNGCSFQEAKERPVIGHNAREISQNQQSEFNGVSLLESKCINIKEEVNLESLLDPTQLYIMLKLPQCICKICGNVFSRQEIKNHLLKLHSNQKQKKCNKCLKIFRKNHKLKEHMVYVHSDKDITECLKCGRLCPSVKAAELHMRIHEINIQSQKQKLECNQCGRYFINYKLFNDHQLIHSMDDAFKCQICGRTFSSRNLLQTHKRAHTKDNGLYFCNRCNEMQETYINLSQHVLNTHGHPINCYKCKEQVNLSLAEEYKTSHCGCKHICEKCYLENCPQIFMKTDVLVKKENHSYQSLFKKVKATQCFCKICKTTYLRNEIKNHMLQCHSDKTDVNCRNCISKFKDIKNLEKHLLCEHSNYHEVQCMLCGSSYINKRNLRNHIRTIHQAEKVLKCPTCGKSFINARIFLEHRLAHKMKYIFNCAVCGTGFPKRSSLKSHICDNHKPGNHYICRLCQRNYHTYFKLCLHIVEIHGSPLKCKVCSNNSKLTKKAEAPSFYKRLVITEYTCYICKKLCKSIIHLKQHLLQIHVDQSTRTCLVCKITLKSKTLHRHMVQKHSNGENCECLKCGKIFNTRQQVRSHLISRHNMSRAKFICKQEDCGKGFTTSALFHDHLLTHTTIHPFKCAECPAGYANKSSLLCHIRAKHTERRKNYVCEVCDAAFTCAYKLRRHMKMHGKPVTCMKCGKKYGSDKGDGYLMHLASNCGNLVCELCGKTFAMKASMKRHMLMHAGETSHLNKCDICQKQFVCKFYLAQHKSMHMKEKAFKCGICDKTYTTQGSIARHMLNHTDQRDHKCLVCDAAFTQAVVLTNHMRIHNDERNHQCETCGQRFRTKYVLTMHMKRHAETVG